MLGAGPGRRRGSDLGLVPRPPPGPGAGAPPAARAGAEAERGIRPEPCPPGPAVWGDGGRPGGVVTGGGGAPPRTSPASEAGDAEGGRRGEAAGAERIPDG